MRRTVIPIFGGELVREDKFRFFPVRCWCRDYFGCLNVDIEISR
jgi:hypothetical protein